MTIIRKWCTRLENVMNASFNDITIALIMSQKSQHLHDIFNAYSLMCVLFLWKYNESWRNCGQWKRPKSIKYKPKFSMVYQLMVKGAFEVMSWMVITSSCLREYKYLKGDLAKTMLLQLLIVIRYVKSQVLGIQYIPRNMHTVLLCFALLWLCNRS